MIVFSSGQDLSYVCWSPVVPPVFTRAGRWTVPCSSCFLFYCMNILLNIILCTLSCHKHPGFTLLSEKIALGTHRIECWLVPHSWSWRNRKAKSPCLLRDCDCGRSSRTVCTGVSEFDSWTTFTSTTLRYLPCLWTRHERRETNSKFRCGLGYWQRDASTSTLHSHPFHHLHAGDTVWLPFR